jgi:hypothetical protein
VLDISRQRLDRPAAGREAHLAGGAVSDDVDRGEIALFREHLRHLACGWVDPADEGRFHLGAQMANKRIYIADTGINEQDLSFSDFPRSHH